MNSPLSIAFYKFSLTVGFDFHCCFAVLRSNRKWICPKFHKQKKRDGVFAAAIKWRWSVTYREYFLQPLTSVFFITNRIIPPAKKHRLNWLNYKTTERSLIW